LKIKLKLKEEREEKMDFFSMVNMRSVAKELGIKSVGKTKEKLKELILDGIDAKVAEVKGTCSEDEQVQWLADNKHLIDFFNAAADDDAAGDITTSDEEKVDPKLNANAKSKSKGKDKSKSDAKPKGKSDAKPKGKSDVKKSEKPDGVIKSLDEAEKKAAEIKAKAKTEKADRKGKSSTSRKPREASSAEKDSLGLKVESIQSKLAVDMSDKPLSIENIKNLPWNSTKSSLSSTLLRLTQKKIIGKNKGLYYVVGSKAEKVAMK